MQHLFISALLAGAAVTTACVLPTDTLSNNIPNGFGILIQNPEFPAIHDQYIMLEPAGGGDMHWFVGGSPPVLNPSDLWIRSRHSGAVKLLGTGLL